MKDKRICEKHELNKTDGSINEEKLFGHSKGRREEMYRNGIK
jgi:hypothetical protein